MNDVDRQLQELRDGINGIQAAMQTEFAVTRRDIQYMTRTNMPMLVVTLIALVLSIFAVSVALENRSLILAVSAQTSKNSRDLENIFPLIFPSPVTPSPQSSSHGK